MKENPLISSFELHKSLHKDKEIYIRKFIKTWMGTGITPTQLQSLMYGISEDIISKEEYDILCTMCNEWQH